jgi:DNA-binding SARP family transcriptional activator
VVYLVLLQVSRRLRRVVGWLRGRQLPPLPTPMQATAGGVIGAAVFGMPTGSLHPPTPPASLPAATVPLDVASPAAPAGASRSDLAGAPGPMDTDQPVGRPGSVADERGVGLPDGGWLDGPTARAVASAAAVVWWQRRRRYLPSALVGAVRDDADLVALPPTVSAVQAVLQAGDHPDDAAERDEGTAGEPAEATSTATATVSGVRVIAAGDLPAGGVGLVGPGAEGAARGLVVTTLLTFATARPSPGARLITTVADLDRLLGSGAAAHYPIPGLTVASGIDEVIALLRRRMIRGRPDAAQVAEPGTAAGSSPARPVVLTGVPDQAATTTRLAALLSDANLGITAVLLGDWPHCQTWRIDGNGHVHRPSHDAVGGRLCVLSATATTDLLAVARQCLPDGADRLPKGPAPVTATGTREDVPAPRAEYPFILPRPQTVGWAHDQTGMPLRLRLLGPPALYQANVSQTPMVIQRSAAWQVLVFLAVHPAGATSGQLIAALWPGPRPQQAGNRLYTPITKLRAALGEAAGAPVLVRDGDRYRLDLQHIDVDLWRLHAAVDRAATAIDPDERHAALHAVVDAYTGELAAGKDWPWLAVPREATRRHVIDAYVALADIAPDPATVLAFLQTAVRIDPVNQQLQRRAHQTRAQLRN